MLDAAMQGLIGLADPTTLLWMIVGVVLGLMFGAMPGLGGTTFMAILVPLTFSMTSQQAIALLIGGHSAIMFGGSISAILINTPGTGQNVATTFDGYPLTQQGRAGEALGASATASAMGGIVGALVLVGFLPILRKVVLAFGPPEFFMMCLFGICVLASISKGSLLKGLIAMVVGLLLSFIGMDIMTGETRCTFGILYLWDGINFIPAIIGLFAIAEAMDLAMKGGTIAKIKDISRVGRGVGKGVKAVFKHWFLTVRSAIFGTIIGIIPGMGGTIANVFAYSQAAATSKHPEKFGTGVIEGVIAPEAANDAKDGGALVPTLAFGIPGSEAMAILLGAFLIHGLVPGPEMLTKHLDLTFLMVFAIIFGGIIGACIGLSVASRLALLTRLPVSILAPLILVISSVGVFGADYKLGDVFLAFIFGFLGYEMKKFGYSRAVLVIALILGEIIERNFHLATRLYGPYFFLVRPIALGLTIALILTLFVPFLTSRSEAKKTV